MAWYRRHDGNLTSRPEEISYYSTRARWKAWRSPLNTASQGRAVRRVWRRLTLRRVWWCGAAAGAALRRRHWGEAAAATAATLAFTRQLVVDRPAPPSARMAHAEARFVDPRSSRAGAVSFGPDLDPR